MPTTHLMEGSVTVLNWHVGGLLLPHISHTDTTSYIIPILTHGVNI